MCGKKVGGALLAVWLAAAGVAFAEQVEVVADSALIKVGDDVIANVTQGERFEVLWREVQIYFCPHPYEKLAPDKCTVCGAR